MPGMNSGLSSDNPTIVAAFRSALLHQGIFVLAVFAVLALAWLAIREWGPPVLTRADSGVNAGPEPAGRQLLRIGFGVIWIFDGLLQAQPAMAEGLPSQVIQPAAATSPGWVQQIVNWAGTSWSYHPIQAGALGGLDPDRYRRLADHRTAGMVVPAGRAGERRLGPGGLGVRRGLRRHLCPRPDLAVRRARGGSVLPRGRPAYRRAGAQLANAAARPDSTVGSWRLLPRHGSAAGLARPRLLAGHGARRQRHAHRHDPVDGRHPPAAVLAGWVSGFASFTAAHGFAVNLFAVIALTAIGAGLLTAGGGRPALLRLTVIALVVLCLADWVLVEDLGFFGGLGTDPNSMIPQALLGVAGYLALTGAPAIAAQPAASAESPPAAESPAEEQPAGAGRRAGRGRAVRATAPGAAGAGCRRDRCGERPGRLDRVGAADRVPGGGPDGDGPDQPQRRPDHRPGGRRGRRPAG